jgi:hypothetical protein
VAEAFGAIAAVAAVGAVFFAWRTVVESRTARLESERMRRLSSLERLCLALSELAELVRRGSYAEATVTQKRALVLWTTLDVEVADDVRQAVVTELSSSNAGQIMDWARSGVDALLEGLEDYLRKPARR